MLVWLASFPRSGNTLLRSMLKQCFGLHTHSKYEPASARPIDSRLSEIIGAATYEGNFFSFLDGARESPVLHIVKTHDAPESDDAAIYLVRNGIVATESYQHYLRNWDQQVVPWRDLIAQPTVHGNWSRHLDAWMPTERMNTILLRYEDLVAHSRDVVDILKRFLSVTQIADWSDPWTTTSAIAPTFFRRGKTTIPDTLSDEDIAAFIAMQGPWMERLGYATQGNAR